MKFQDGPQSFSKHFVEPVDGMTQTLHIHLEEYAPGGRTQKHGHVNEAAFYILDGKGYEIHDGVRYDWQAGDVAIVHNNCVHQHFNADPDKPARALVLKSKPMFMFMNIVPEVGDSEADLAGDPTRGLRAAARRATTTANETRAVCRSSRRSRPRRRPHARWVRDEGWTS
jgi:quercetin dioxygenase-like cupin family protein